MPENFYTFDGRDAPSSGFCVRPEVQRQIVVAYRDEIRGGADCVGRSPALLR